MRLLLFCLFYSLLSLSAFAQSTIEQQMKWYSLAKPTSNLFLHFDKNIYSNNETVYFTGYLVKSGRTLLSNHQVMAIALVRDADSALIIEDKFLIKNGVSMGSLTLPDSIPTGNYHFIAYTDKLLDKIPEALFIQNITIKSSIEPPFKANIKLVDTSENKSPKILVSATSKEGRFLLKPAQITYTYGENKRSTLTDASGQAVISLPSIKNITDPNVYVKLKYERDSSFVSIALPQGKITPTVKFYPEGGNMVSQLVSNISWEVKDQQNRPIALKAFLLKNKTVIDTIETNSYGIGKFMLRPELTANYSVKLIHSGLVDSTYNLPPALEKGLVLTLKEAFVGDTLRINLKSTETRNLTFLVHDFKTCFLAIPFNMTYTNMIAKLPLAEIPKGLTTLTVLDSLGRPLSERIFFAHYSDLEGVNIQTDQQIYKKREQVKLKLDLKIDEQALVSIAAVQLNRLVLKKTQDIESYTYLNNELNALPIIVNGRPYKDREYLEQMLSVKSWRRYTWQGLRTTKPADTLVNLESLKVSGQVSRPKKEIKDSLLIGTMGTQHINLINTDKKGFFNLSENDLLTPFGKKMYVFISGAKDLPYETKIAINDEYATLNQKLIKSLLTEQPILPSNLVNNAELVLKNNEKTINLKEVVITHKSDDRFQHRGTNACGDYVCKNNILNCPNHFGDFGNTQPVKGKLYTRSGTRLVEAYMGCNVPDLGIFTLISSVHAHKEFYTDDYKDPNEPAFFSTIYWNYGTIVDSKKQTELSFYTSDITGKFKIIVQGITNKDVVYGEHIFEVK